MKPIQFTLPVYGDGVFALLEDKKSNFYNYYHRHEELQISCIIKGAGTIMVGNIIQSFQEGDIFILRPNEPHMLDKYGEGKRYVADIHAIHLFINIERIKKLSIIPEFEQVISFLADLDTSKKLAPSLAKEIKKFFFDLIDKVAIPRFIDFLHLLHALTSHPGDMTSIYSGLRNAGYTDKSGERLSTVCKFTFEQYQKQISISEVASLVHMTPSSFCKFFKKHTMKTYTRFLHEVRIEKACQILINNQTESIAETAFMVGFNNVIHFNRVFKQVTLLSPQQYLNRHKVI